MRKFAWVAPLTIIISLASACEGNKNPLETAPAPASKVTPGVYDMSAEMTGIDQTFSDFKTLSSSAVLTIEREPTDGSRLTGRFTDFRTMVDGQQSFCCITGVLKGVVDRNGRVTLDLKRDDGTFVWAAAGFIVGESRIEGKWQGRSTTGELTVDLGPFRAELRRNP
jgi:hypothetical protein